MKHTNANLYPNAKSMIASLAEFKQKNPSAKITKFSSGKTGRKSECAMVFVWED